MNIAWVPHAFSLELRKLLSYRVDFWMNLGGAVTAELVMAYFLWHAMFHARGVTEMGGYTFRGMMLYYLLVPLIGRMVRGEESRFLSEDIYEGGLTRYLVYPISFLQYKYVSLLVYTFLSATQLLLALAVFALAFGIPPELAITFGSLVQGFSFSIGATLLYFFMAGSLEMVAFWQDSVWSLVGMLRMAMLLTGGGLIPLPLFPERWQSWLAWSPFPYMISFPIRCFLGQVSGTEGVRGAGVVLVWVAVFYGVSQWIWRRGTRHYSGVGL